MPKDLSVKKIMVIGSGPIIIGQAAEFDYAGTQACRSLKQEGYEVVLVNSNPATIMTDGDMASKVYMEPLTLTVVKRILLDEGCDALLASLGGQTGLNIAMELSESGFLDEHGIRLLGTSAEGIKRGEDRELFREAMLKIGVPCIPSGIGLTLPECEALAAEIGYPVIVRPAFTLGGTGGGIVDDIEALREVAATGLEVSRVHQVLIEKSIAGWKEIEFESVRDGAGNAITVCSMENFDPVGIHTGDSIVFAPALSLKESELQMLRQATLDIVHELGIEGGCNVQFALHPTSGEYAVIEVNPRLSRSSALASKATAYPIAKVATRIAVGYRLPEIRNKLSGRAWAAEEPQVDYFVAKIPKWPFDKFVYAKRTLGTQMKATGEVMAIGGSLQASLIKAVRSLEQNCHCLLNEANARIEDEALCAALAQADDRRLFYLCEAMRRGYADERLYALTRIDFYFLNVLRGMVELETELMKYRGLARPVDAALLERAWSWSYSDYALALLCGREEGELRRLRMAAGKPYTFRILDSGASEEHARCPYYYSEIGGVDEVVRSPRKKVLVLGSGPIRIGQGIEFDYCSVHCVQALRALGWEAIIINNNPETVSTDFDTADRLYFEPLTPSDVRAILEKERPDGVICQFGGQTAIKLIKAVSDMGYPILGTSADGVDRAEDRERFDEVLERCGIPRPQGSSVFTTEEALAVAARLGYPVLLRPSYVLGGQGMMICRDAEAVREYMGIINRNVQEHPILVDKYLMGTELEVDALSDGEDILIPGIMEHLERAGIHSGDSISIFPAYISEKNRAKIIDYTEKLARELKVVGLINIQFILYNDELYVLEVNPRSSRTVPYISKVSGLPIVDLATRVMLGKRVADLGKGTGLFARYPAVYAIKAPVFSFEKLHDVDTILGPEMKSTGEVLGLSERYSEAMFKAIQASGFKFPRRGERLLLTVRDSDKAELLPLAERLHGLGFSLYATGGTANYLNRHGIPTNACRNVDEASPNARDLVREGKIKMLVNTSDRNTVGSGGFRLRRLCIEHGIPSISSLDTLVAVTECLEGELSLEDLKLYAIDDFAARVERTRLNLKPLNEMSADELEFLRSRL